MANRIAQRLARRIKSRNLRERTAISLFRATPGSRNQFGEFVPGTKTEIAIEAIVLPMSGEEVLSLPEGLRVENLRKFISETEIRAVQEGDDPTPSDRILFDGGEWRVESVSDWGGYFEAVCAEVRDA